MNILFIGDIVARLGRSTVTQILPSLREDLQIDVVIGNAENAAGGKGVTKEVLAELQEAGIDYFTSGDHIFWRNGFKDILSDEFSVVLRPSNLADDVIGRGYMVVETRAGKLGIINLIGTVGAIPLSGSSDLFREADRILEEIGTGFPIIVDIHAEYTSEKRALGFYLTGRASGVFGTHTHVPTADAQILEDYTAYITDVGMTGSLDSVLGVDKEIIIMRQKFPYPQKFEWVTTGRSQFNAVFVNVDKNGRAIEIKRIDRSIP